MHPALVGTAALLPYLDRHWREQVISRGIDGLELTSFAPQVPAMARPDWRRGNGPAVGLDAIQTQLLQPFGLDAAICNCLYGVQAAVSEDLSAVLCRALNDYIAAELLAHDDRLRASIVVPMLSPELAVAEIERCAPDHRFVQVLFISMGDTMLGRRRLWPIYAAAERHGLPIGVHAGSLFRQAPTGAGWPSYRAEHYVLEALTFQNHLQSLAFEGVFGKFPGLRFVLLESGFAWLPAFLWRANKLWKAMRIEAPWLDRPPADLIRERISVTVQPFDGPTDADDLARVVEQIGADRMFLFSTDYPHHQFDGTDALPDAVAPALAARMGWENPLETFPRLAATLQ